MLTDLGLAYQLRWRETADASFLPRSDAALRRALRARPGDPNAVLGLGSLALIRHEFRAALRHGRRAARLLEGSARPYGVIGDALVELGRYDEAFRAFERMVALRPNLASYARIAYARELTGDRAGAIAAMKLALDAAGGQPEPAAWALVELAKLERATGRPGLAERRLREAARLVPGYPAAGAELAHVLAARGELERAIARARASAESVPTAAAVSLLADLLDRAGRSNEAARQRATVAVIDRLQVEGGVEVDLETALHRADNRIRPLETVELARRARADRPSIHGDDALAWALARAGLCREALPFAERALRLGTRDPLLLLPPRLRRGLRRRPRGDARVVRARAVARSGVLRALGAIRPRRASFLNRNVCRRLRPYHRDVDRTRAWLAVLPFVAGGVLVSHALAYRLTGTPGGSLHAYLEHAPQVVVLAALVGLALAGLASRLRAPAAWPFAAAALLVFVVQEHAERVVHTGEVPWLLTSPAFLVGLLLHVPVALAAWALARRLLHSLTETRAPRALFPSLLPAVLRPHAIELRPLALSPLGSRGPPFLRRH